MRDFIDLIKAVGSMLAVSLAVVAVATGGSVALVYWVGSVECAAYGRQTGREVVYDWGCYAMNDDGKRVPANRIDRAIAVSVKQ